MVRRGRIWLTLALVLAMVGGQLPSYLLGQPTTAAAVNGTVSGTVYDASGAVIPGFRVRAENRNTFSFSYALTDGAGLYTFDLPSAPYIIAFPPVGGAAFQVYDDAPSYATATTITVNGVAHTGIDATLHAGTRVSGTVRNFDRSPAAGIDVTAHLSTQNGGPAACCWFVANATTAADGTYSFYVDSRITPKVQFAKGTPREQWYSGKDNPTNVYATGFNAATDVYIDGERTNIDAQLLAPTFAASPTTGPVGTSIAVRSITPCVAPAGAPAWISIASFAQGENSQLSYQNFAVAADGSWSGTLAVPAAAVLGAARLIGACFDSSTGLIAPLNYASLDFTVVAPTSAEIRATLTTVPKPAPGDVIGRPMTFTGTVTNGGLDTATNVAYSIQLPPSVPVTGGTSTQGTCRKWAPSLESDFQLSSNVLICDIGILLAGASATITLTPTPLAVGTFTALAHAGADQVDPVATNNDVTLSFDVHGRNNHTWTTAGYLPLTGGSTSPGGVTKYGDSDFLTKAGQSDWYKVHIAPGQKLLVKVTGVGGNLALPADYSLALFKDIKAYLDHAKTTVGGPDLVAARAAIQNHDASTSPDALSPDALSPDALSPDALSPDALSPDALSPDALSPDALSPDELSPDELSPDALSPDALSPDALSPDALSPDALSPDAYSGAQTATILRVSAHQGTSPEQIIQNTWTNTGDFYLRVRGHNGAFAPLTPFQITAELSWTACSGVTLAAVTPILPAVVGAPKTVIVTNSSRFGAAPTGALLSALDKFRSAPGVGDGVVIDLATDGADPYGLKAAYDQWRDHLTCPGAANIVADGIKSIIDAFRPSLKYVVLAGGDHVLPYLRTPDQAGLGNEQGFQPGLGQDTAGEASLQFGYTLTQDYYGTRAPIAHFDHSFYLADVAVGRLVETPSEILAVIGAYTTAGGVVHVGGTRALDSGYDFLSDTATFVQTALAPAMTVDSPSLIQLRHATTPPTIDPAWTADQLRSYLFARHYGIISLNGHFSANTLLAADFATRIQTSEVAPNAANFLNTLIISTGCHSGYNIVDPEALANTNKLDWAQAFAGAGAELIGSTGYGYGDTDFIKYTELIVANFTTELTYGAAGDAVAIGSALMNAKRSYAAGLPALRGIDEKALMEATLYGLPMWSIDIGANGRQPRPLASTVSPSAVIPAVPGLSSVAIIPNYTLNRRTVSLGSDGPIATYYDNAGQVAASPATPVLPLTQQSIGAAGSNARGVVLMDATYADEPGITPFTDVAGTELSGLHPGFSSPVFAPVRTFTINGLTGGPSLVTTPAQFKSTGANIGILRRWTTEQFQVFYSSRTDAAAALAGSPIVYSINAHASGTQAVFDVTTAAVTDPGFARAYLTYTAETAPLYGSWHSVLMTYDPTADLIQLDASGQALSTIRHYTFAVDGGTAPEDVRAFVQIVGGNGLVSMSTNDGAYYRVPAAGSGSTPGITSILIGGDSHARYLSRATVSATLIGGVADLPVTLTLGHQRADVLTGTGGVASVQFIVRTEPGATAVTATFAGTAAYLGSSALADFTVDLGTPSLALNPLLTNPTALQYTESVLVATLGLGGISDGQSVTLGANGATVSALTDPLGRIRLDSHDLLVPGPNAVTINFTGNDRFGPASANLNVTLVAEDATVALPALSPVPAGSLSLTGQVTELVDGTAGDLSKAQVTYVLRNEGGTAVATIIANAMKTGAAPVTFTNVAAGLYHVEATVTGGYYTSPLASAIAVMYDTSTFVTGGGWLLTTTASTGLVAGKKANFGFNAKYLSGSTKPAGSVEFSAKESTVSFKATSFDWLVISTGRAELEGKGTDGTGVYGFRLIAVDGSPDMFELRIWTASGSFDAPLYKVSGGLGGGNIVVH